MFCYLDKVGNNYEGIQGIVIDLKKTQLDWISSIFNNLQYYYCK